MQGLAAWLQASHSKYVMGSWEYAGCRFIRGCCRAELLLILAKAASILSTQGQAKASSRPACCASLAPHTPIPGTYKLSIVLQVRGAGSTMPPALHKPARASLRPWDSLSRTPGAPAAACGGSAAWTRVWQVDAHFASADLLASGGYQRSASTAVTKSLTLLLFNPQTAHTKGTLADAAGDRADSVKPLFACASTGAALLSLLRWQLP